MKKIVLVAALSISGLAFAQGGKDTKGAPAAAPAAKDVVKGEPNGKTCGQMIKEHAVFPAKFAELMDAIVAMHDEHIKWTMASSKEKAAKQEVDVMKKLNKQLATVSAAYKKMAADMEKAGNLPPAPHDMAKMDPKLGESLAKMAAAEKEVSALLAKDAAEMAAMLDKGGAKK